MGISLLNGRPCQSCDIVIQADKDIKPSFELFGVKLYMLGSHQLQNAVTATYTALCLHNLGWRISDGSIKAGLENSCLLGRAQFLTSMEAERLGLPNATIMLDGAHSKESVRASVHTIQMAFPGACLALVAAMASNKDHAGFASEFLSGGQIVAVLLTEFNIAGAKSRTTSALLLKDCWIQASKELGIAFLQEDMAQYKNLLEAQFDGCKSILKNKTILASEASVLSLMKIAKQILRCKSENGSGITVVSGYLHIVSLVLSTLHG